MTSLPRHWNPLDHMQMAAERPLFQNKSLALPRSLNTLLMMDEWVGRWMDLVEIDTGLLLVDQMGKL